MNFVGGETAFLKTRHHLYKKHKYNDLKMNLMKIQ